MDAIGTSQQGQDRIYTDYELSGHHYHVIIRAYDEWYNCVWFFLGVRRWFEENEISALHSPISSRHYRYSFKREEDRLKFILRWVNETGNCITEGS